MADLLLPATINAAIDADIEQRTKVHQATIAQIKSASIHANNLNLDLTQQSRRPLVLLSHGDSWFDYPLDGNSLTIGTTDVIAQLKSLGPQPPVILNLSHAGDATTDSMSLPKQQRMVQALLDKDNWLENGKPDAILFSGGGDDIAGNQFCIFLDFAAPGVAGLNEDRFNGLLGAVRASYLDLFAFRDRNAPDVPIIGHSYDFPTPDGRHPICAGPWLRPSLLYCNWTVAQGAAIVKTALERFCTMLETLAVDPKNNFILVSTQGTLEAADWANELHPYPAGFKKIAQKFADTIDGRFP